MTKQEQLTEMLNWRERLSKLTLTEKELQVTGWKVGKLENFGYEQGDLRPGELGQWDLYYSLIFDFAIVQAEREDELRECGVDPNNRHEVAEHERLKRMSQDELTAEIELLESLLKGSR